MLIFGLLIVRIVYLQFIKGPEYKEYASKQQVLSQVISPKRGTIYDSTGTKILAVSSTVRSVTVNPVNISEIDKEKVAKALSEILGVDYEKTIQKLNKKTGIETIVTKICN